MKALHGPDIRPVMTEKGLLRIGGICSILFMIFLVSALLATYVPPEATRTDVRAEVLRRLTQSSLQFIILNTFYILYSTVAIVFLLTLYMLLRKESPRYSLLGTLIGVSAFFVFAITSLLGASISLNLAELYAKTSTDRWAAAAVAEASSSTLSAVSLTAIAFMSVALVAFGTAVRRSALVPRNYGLIGVVFGIISFTIFIALSITGRFGLGAAPTALSVVIWFSLVGQKLYRLSKVA